MKKDPTKYLFYANLGLSCIYVLFLILQIWIDKFIPSKIFTKISLTYVILMAVSIVTLMILKDVAGENELKKNKFLSD
jgi:hypothetical protein